jgi:hypothetical protein
LIAIKIKGTWNIKIKMQEKRRRGKCRAYNPKDLILVDVFDLFV